MGIEEWVKNDGSGEKGVTMSCKLVSFDFVSDGTGSTSPQPAPERQPAPRNAQAAQAAPQAPPQNQPMGVSQQAQDNFDDDIPF